MDVPSTSRTSRTRPTALNRRLRQRFVAIESEDDEEVFEEQPQTQVETEVSEQAEAVPERTSTVAGEIPGGPTSLSLLPSFRTHIAASIWQQQVCE